MWFPTISLEYKCIRHLSVFDPNLLYVTDVTGMLIALYDHLYKLLSYSIYKYSIYLTNVICTVQISSYPVYQSIMVGWVKWNKDHWLDSCEISANPIDNNHSEIIITSCLTMLCRDTHYTYICLAQVKSPCIKCVKFIMIEWSETFYSVNIDE